MNPWELDWDLENWIIAQTVGPGDSPPEIPSTFPTYLPGLPSFDQIPRMVSEMLSQLVGPMLMDPSYMTRRQRADETLRLLFSITGKLPQAKDPGDRSNIYERDGGYDQAKKDFGSLALNNVRKIGDNKWVRDLSDGRTVIVRGYSTDNRKPTLEIQIKDSRGQVILGLNRFAVVLIPSGSKCPVIPSSRKPLISGW